MRDLGMWREIGYIGDDYHTSVLVKTFTKVSAKAEACK